MSIRMLAALAFCAVIAAVSHTAPAEADEAATIENKSRAALVSLVKNSEDAALLNKEAVGVLVFPEVVKGGLIVAGLYGEGTLLTNNNADSYYSTKAASIGLQAGIQKFGYAVFFMNEKAMGYLDESEGWEIGSAPSLVVVDKGIAGKLSTTSARESIYVFYFDQKGLMGGLGIEGTKISQFTPE